MFYPDEFGVLFSLEDFFEIEQNECKNNSSSSSSSKDNNVPSVRTKIFGYLNSKNEDMKYKEKYIIFRINL